MMSCETDHRESWCAASYLARGKETSHLLSIQGLDELTPMGDADVVEVTQNSIHRYRLEPRDLGIPR